MSTIADLKKATMTKILAVFIGLQVLLVVFGGGFINVFSPTFDIPLINRIFHTTVFTPVLFAVVFSAILSFWYLWFFNPICKYLGLEDSEKTQEKLNAIKERLLWFYPFVLMSILGFWFITILMFGFIPALRVNLTIPFSNIFALRITEALLASLISSIVFALFLQSTKQLLDITVYDSKKSDMFLGIKNIILPISLCLFLAAHSIHLDWYFSIMDLRGLSPSVSKTYAYIFIVSLSIGLAIAASFVSKKQDKLQTDALSDQLRKLATINVRSGEKIQFDLSMRIPIRNFDSLGEIIIYFNRYLNVLQEMFGKIKIVSDTIEKTKRTLIPI